jgi:hypothetical protein
MLSRTGGPKRGDSAFWCATDGPSRSARATDNSVRRADDRMKSWAPRL